MRPVRKRVLGMALVCAAFVTGSAAAVPTLPSATVCPSGPPVCDFTQIAPALDAVLDDGTVTVAPGTYAGGFQFFRNVRLTGSGVGVSIISGPTVIVEPEATAVVIDGFTIQGAEGSQVLNVGGLTLRNVTIRNAARNPIESEAPGGIWNSGNLVVRNATITGVGNLIGGVNNSGTALLESSVIRASEGLAGGVWNSGRMTLRDSSVVDNVSVFNGGIVNLDGASLVVRGGEISRNTGQGASGISNSGSAVVVDTLISGNQLTALTNGGSLTLQRVTVRGWGTGLGGRGGLDNGGSAVIRDSIFDGRDVVFSPNRMRPAITNDATGTMTITGSTVRRSPGGGIANAGTLTVRSTTVRRNTSDRNGAGINNSGFLILRDSSVRLNVADQSGGGIWNSGTARLVESSVTGNTALDVLATGLFGGGIANVPGGTVTLVRSAVSANTPDNCAGC